MAKVHLTDERIKRLTPPAKGLRIVRDSTERGFGVRLLPSGTASFVLSYTVPGGGKRRILTIAEFQRRGNDDQSEKARKKARALKDELKDKGLDPAGEKRRREAEAARAWDVNRAIEAFEDDLRAKVESGDLRPSSLRIYQPRLRILRDKFGPRKIADIRWQELEEWHRFLSKPNEALRMKGRIGANAVIAVAKAVFAFAIEREVITVNPAKRVRLNKAKPRSRVLDLDECRKVWNAAGELPKPHGHVIRLLLLLAARREEIARLRWDEVNLAKGEIILPSERTKNRREHVLPLPNEALELLRALPRDGSVVFPPRRGTSVSGFSTIKRKLDELSGVTGWVIHDLRRSCASHMAELGVRFEVLEKILNHKGDSASGLRAVYNQHDYRREAFEALSLWARRLLLHSDEEPNVIDINARRATTGG